MPRPPGVADDALSTPIQQPIERALHKLLRRTLSSPRLVRLLGRRKQQRAAGRLAPDIAGLLALNELMEAARLAQSPHQARKQMADSIRLVDAPPRAPLAISDHELSIDGRTISLRMYAARSATQPGIVYFHGGGWVIGSVTTHDAMCRRLALEVGCRVMSVRYRLAPEAPFPAAVEDAIAATRAVHQHADALGVTPTAMAVAGDSAGGNLAAVVAQRLKDEPAAPALQVLIYPAVDATMSFPSIDAFAEGYLLTREKMDWYLGHYRGNADKRDPDLSPLYRPDLSGLCPALIYTAGFDPLRDEGMAYAERLRDVGVEVTARCFDDTVHGFANMTGTVPSAHAAFQTIAADIRTAVNNLR